MRSDKATRKQITVAAIVVVVVVVGGCSGAGAGGDPTLKNGVEEEQPPLSIPADPDHVVVVGEPLPTDFRDLIESLPDPGLTVNWHAIVQVNDALFVVDIISVQKGSVDTTVQVPMTGSGFEWAVAGSAVYLLYDTGTYVVTSSVIQVDGDQISHEEATFFIVKQPFGE